MTDRDHAQINAIELCDLELKVWLCKWHVLHAWHQHFNIAAFLHLWQLLQDLLRAPTPNQFDLIWKKI